MNPETWIAIVAALISVVAAVLNWRSAHAAEREAHAAEEQTRIQRQLRVDSAQPYVWADIRADEAQGTRLNLVIGNSGPTVAKKVRVKTVPPLPATAQFRKGVQAAQVILTDGIESLPPGRTLVWGLGSAPELMYGDKIPQSYKFTITADGPFGKVPALTYIVNMKNWRESQDIPAGSLFELTREVERLRKKIAVADSVPALEHRPQ